MELSIDPQRSISNPFPNTLLHYVRFPNSSTESSIVPKRSHFLTVKFQDTYGFNVEGNVDDVNVLNEVRERVREQGGVWWALELRKGPNWYLQPKISSNYQGIITVASLSPSVFTNTLVLKKLVRKGIPPKLRPRLWFFLSGAAKKRSMVPAGYYNDLICAIEGRVTPATEQIDHVRTTHHTETCHIFLSFSSAD